MTKNNTKNMQDQDGLRILYYPGALIHEHQNTNGSVFHSVSFHFRDAWASFIVPENSMSQSTDRNGAPIEGRFNLDLDDPADVRNVSVQQEDETFARTPMFNRTILSAISANRQEYLRTIAV